jgi:hypothetical protein
MEQEKYTFGGQKVQNRTESSKTKFGAQSQYNRVIRIIAHRSKSSGVLRQDQKFYINQSKINFCWTKSRK